MTRAACLPLGVAAWILVISTVSHSAASRHVTLQEPTVPTETPVQLFNRMCSDCHDADRIVSPRRTKAEWEDVIREMIVEGATGSEKDFQGVFEYLLLNYGKVYINTARPDEITLVLGLTKKDADAIVTYRTASGPFADVEALKKVPEIDLKKLEEHKDAVVF